MQQMNRCIQLIDAMDKANAARMDGKKMPAMACDGNTYEFMRRPRWLAC